MGTDRIIDKSAARRLGDIMVSWYSVSMQVVVSYQWIDQFISLFASWYFTPRNPHLSDSPIAGFNLCVFACSFASQALLYTMSTLWNGANLYLYALNSENE